MSVEKRITGMRPESFIGKTNEELGMDPALCSRWSKVLKTVFATGKKESLEFTYIREGTEEHYSAVCVPEFSEYHEVSSVLCVARNVSELRRVADLAKSREARLNLITEAAGVGVFEWDFPDGDFCCKNKAALEVLAVPPGTESLTSRALAERIPGERDLQQLEAAIRFAKASGQPFRQLCRLQPSRNHPPRWVEFVGRTEQAAGDSKPRCMGFLNDVTEKVLSTQRLREARDAAEEANAVKDKFLATLSHELRTPLTPALMLLGMLEESEGLSGSVRHDLSVIRSNVEAEARLVDDLLDLARITNGKLRISRESVSPDGVVNRALQTVAGDFAAKQIHVESDFDPDCRMVSADPIRLQQVLWNLLRNAAKFTPVGGRVLVQTRSSHDTWTVAVTDSGIGLEAANLSRIFAPFVQVGSTSSGRHGGLGLGLSISASLVREHGGRIWAESPGLNRGTTLTVELPTLDRAKTANPAISLPGNVSHAQLRILVAEDHTLTLTVILRLLGLRGHQVQGVRTVAEGKEAADSERFDLLICDLGLPDGHGTELLKYLKQKATVSAIALTGEGSLTQVEASKLAGFDMHLVKPVPLADLDRAVSAIATVDLK